MDYPHNDYEFFLMLMEFIRNETCSPDEHAILDVQLDSHPDMRVAFISSNTDWNEFTTDPYTGFHHQFQNQNECAHYFHHEFPLISREQFVTIADTLKKKFGGIQCAGILGNLYYISTSGKVFAMWFVVPKLVAQFEHKV